MADAELGILLTLKDEATAGLQRVRADIGETGVSFARASSQFRYGAMEITLAVSAISSIFQIMKSHVSEADKALVAFGLSAMMAVAALIRLVGILQATQISIIGVKVAAWELTLAIGALAYIIDYVVTAFRVKGLPTFSDMAETITNMLAPLKAAISGFMGVKASVDETTASMGKLKEGMREIQGIQFEWTPAGWSPVGSAAVGREATFPPRVTMGPAADVYNITVQGSVWGASDLGAEIRKQVLWLKSRSFNAGLS